MAKTRSWLLDDAGVFDRLRSRLVASADQQAAGIMEFEPELTNAQLVETLQVALALDPLELDEPNAVRIELDPTALRLGEAQYLHQMTARYQGSRGLWKVRPSVRTTLRLGGKASATMLTVEDWLPSRLFDLFEARTRGLLDEVRAVLPLQQPAIDAFNAELVGFCPGYVKGRAEELVSWRRRGQQRREREQKQVAFRETLPDIDPVIPEWKRLAARLVAEGHQL